MTISLVTLLTAAALIGLGFIAGRLSAKAAPPKAESDFPLYGMGEPPRGMK